MTTLRRRRWEETKRTSKVTWDDFLAQTRSTWDEATSTPHSWLSNMSDAVACAWDDSKCRAGNAWQGLKEALHLGGKVRPKSWFIFSTAACRHGYI